ncbi:MAG TPA: hypothetical protein VGA61_11060 [Anaerolineae bacterium]
MIRPRIWLLAFVVFALAACVPGGRQPLPSPAWTPATPGEIRATSAVPASVEPAATSPLAPTTAATAVLPVVSMTTASAPQPTALPVSPLPQPSPSITPVPGVTSSPAPPARSGPRPAAERTPTAAPVVPEISGASTYVETLLVAPGQPGRLYALVQKGIGPLWAFPADEVRLLISDDFARTWVAFPGGLPAAPACMINIGLDYYPPTTLYANTCQGLYAWQNNAWQRRSERVTNLVAVVYGKPDSIWAAEPGKSIIRSDDGGRTWRDAGAGMVNFGGMSALGIDPHDANTVYGMIRPKYAGHYLRRISGNGQWQMMPGPVSSSTVDMGIAIDGASGAFFVTTMVAPVQLWRSLNANTMNVDDIRWELVHDFGDRVQVRLLASGWSPQGMALYANFWPLTPAPGGGASVGNPAFYRSLDGGANWQLLATP